ncbi:MAG: hypothetical protein ACLU6S_01030 [Clostridium sp.]|uniref:hypothetical protein n=1 Tax=Clostridium sp. TaxID=1506 RepID=UPI00399B0AF9
MNRKEYIEGLKDIKEYLSEKVSFYGNDSEWSKDVKVIQMAIALAEGTTKDVGIREGLKEIERRVKSLQICISLLGANITIAIIILSSILRR